MDQELSVNVMAHGLDLCRVKGKEMAMGGGEVPVVRFESERDEVQQGWDLEKLHPWEQFQSLFCSSLCAGY